MNKLSAILVGLIGIIVISLIINFIPATIAYYVLGFIGFHFAYLKVYLCTYLIVLIFKSI